jgi:hypothetical protein
VSFISCIVFDAGKNTLGTLGKFTFVAATCDFEGKPASDLLSYLRDMRTAFQHAVNTENDRNNRNLENVANWYCRHCGSGTPQKRHFRVLTERLLRDWELFVEGVGRVVANLGRTKTTKLVRNQLKLAARNLEGGDLLEMIERAGRLIGAALDTVAFKKKHEASIRDHMKNSPLSGPLLLDFVYKKVEEAVIAECNLCPVDGEWLIKQGVPQSPKMGKLLKQFQSDWDQAPPGQDKELFLRNAAATVQAYLERMA